MPGQCRPSDVAVTAGANPATAIRLAVPGTGTTPTTRPALGVTRPRSTETSAVAALKADPLVRSSGLAAGTEA